VMHFKAVNCLFLFTNLVSHNAICLNKGLVDMFLPCYNMFLPCYKLYACYHIMWSSYHIHIYFILGKQNWLQYFFVLYRQAHMFTEHL
ncbi:hypothetical protein ACJX0J_007177, partial [Zea mays]